MMEYIITTMANLLVHPPFWQFQLDHELGRFPLIDDHKMQLWLRQHDPEYPNNPLLTYRTLENCCTQKTF